MMDIKDFSIEPMWTGKEHAEKVEFNGIKYKVWTEYDEYYQLDDEWLGDIGRDVTGDIWGDRQTGQLLTDGDELPHGKRFQVAWPRENEPQEWYIDLTVRKQVEGVSYFQRPLVMAIQNDERVDYEEIERPHWLGDTDDLIIVFPKARSIKGVLAALDGAMKELKVWLDKGNFVVEDGLAHKVLGDVSTRWSRNEYRYWNPGDITEPVLDGADNWSNKWWNEHCRARYGTDTRRWLIDNLMERWQRREGFGDDWYFVDLFVKCPITGEYEVIGGIESDAGKEYSQELLLEQLGQLYENTAEEREYKAELKRLAAALETDEQAAERKAVRDMLGRL